MMMNRRASGINPAFTLFLGCCWALSLLLAPSAIAQNAPEGNAHPQTADVSESGGLPNPFGTVAADPASVVSRDKKWAFASAIDLKPLEGAAILHNGRVKIVQTLARETVSKVTGRKQYAEYEKDPATAKVREFKYSPTFTFFDLMIDAPYYVDKPLIGIGYLPLRQEIVERNFPGKELQATRELWLKTGRVTPLMISTFLDPVLDSNMGNAAMLNGAGQVDQAMRLFMSGTANLLMIAPVERSLPWSHLSSLPPEAPARVAAADLGRAWRNQDATAANEAITRLAVELPKLNSEHYPSNLSQFELAYNKSRAFEWGYLLYFLSLVLLLIAMGTGRSTLKVLGLALLFGGLAAHAGGFVARCIIAERFAIQNQFESMTGISLFAAIVASVIMAARKQLVFGAAAAAVGFMVLVAATQTAIPGQNIEREAAILNTSVLLKYHVTTVLNSYGLIALGMVISLFYLGTHYFARQSAPASSTPAVALGGGGAIAGGSHSSHDPSADAGAGIHKLLADLDKAQMIVLQLAFWTLAVGILLGAWWADHSWGRWWAFDPKETWALITWIAYLIVIHVRMAGVRNKGLVTAWLSIAGFIVMVWTYFGVNLLLAGLHAYA